MTSLYLLLMNTFQANLATWGTAREEPVARIFPPGGMELVCHLSSVTVQGRYWTMECVELRPPFKFSHEFVPFRHLGESHRPAGGDSCILHACYTTAVAYSAAVQMSPCSPWAKDYIDASIPNALYSPKTNSKSSLLYFEYNTHPMMQDWVPKGLSQICLVIATVCMLYCSLSMFAWVWTPFLMCL